MTLRNQTYVHPDTRPERIVAAAIRQDGKVWSGGSHSGLIYGPMAEDLCEPGEIPIVLEYEKGFLGDNGMFLSRKSARRIAKKAGQIPMDFNEVLLSQHLW